MNRLYDFPPPIGDRLAISDLTPVDSTRKHLWNFSRHWVVTAFDFPPFLVAIR